MGKSTLLLQALGRMAARRRHAACWSPRRSRARRCGCGPSAWARSQPDLLVVAETSLPARRSPTPTPSGPQVLAVDSIQTVVDPDLPGAPGSVTQVRDCAYRLVQQAKEHGLRHGAGRARHQGGHARRAARARARRRHRALVRRRPRPLAACAAHAEAPVRRHRRGRAVRDDRARAWSTCPTRRRASSSTAAPACRARRSPRCSRARGPILVEVQALVDAHGGADAASVGGGHGVRAAWRCCSPVLEQHAGVDSPPAPTSTRASPAVCASPSAASTSRSRSRSPARSSRPSITRGTVVDRRARPGRRGRGRCRSSSVGSPRRRGSGSARGGPEGRACGRADRRPGGRARSASVRRRGGAGVDPGGLSTGGARRGLRYLWATRRQPSRESPPCPPHRDQKP